MKKREITVIGAAILDVLTYPVSKSVFETGSRPVESTMLSFGGDALNEAVILSRLGKRVNLLTNIGHDPAGKMIAQFCEENGIFLQNVASEDDLQTGINIVMADEKGERYFFTNPNSSLRLLKKDEIIGQKDEFRDIVSFASIFVSEKLPVSELEEVFRVMKEKDRILCADMTKAKHGEKLKDLEKFLPYVDYLFPNREEIALLTGTGDVEKNAELLIELGVGCVAIKMGAEGCFLKNREKTVQLPAYPVSRCIDTTGAGDTFAAGFLWGLSENRKEEECAKFGMAAASLVVEKPGATEGLHGLEEVLQRYRNHWS